MIKKLLVLSIFVIFSFVIFFHKQLTYNPFDVSFFGYSFDLSWMVDNFYIKYFYVKDNDPKMLWDDKIFAEYKDYCHKNEKKCMIFPHQQTYSSFLWISSIQYVGTVLRSERARYLYSLIDSLTNVSPYWEYPYEFWQLMIPISKESNVQEEIKKQSWDEAIRIWKKGKKYNCDPNKIDRIKQLDQHEFYNLVFSQSWKYEDLKNPCGSHSIPYNLAFNYFYYLSDWEKSAQNYMITSFIENSPTASPSMVSVVTWRMWQHLQSMQLWFSQFLFYMEQLQEEDIQQEWEFLESMMDEAINKVVFELQLYLLSEADDIIGSDDECFRDYDCLVREWYVSEIVNQKVEFCLENQQYLQTEEILPDFSNQAICFALDYWLNNWYISNDGDLTYPIEDWFIFYWDEGRFDSWWIRKPSR